LFQLRILISISGEIFNCKSQFKTARIHPIKDGGWGMYFSMQWVFLCIVIEASIFHFTKP